MDKFVIAAVILAIAVLIAQQLSRRKPEPPTQQSWTCTATASLRSISALASIRSHDSHVAEVNTATSHGASGRSKSARSSCCGTVHACWVGGSGFRRESCCASSTAIARITAAMTTLSIRRLSPRSSARADPRSRLRRERATDHVGHFVCPLQHAEVGPSREAEQPAVTQPFYLQRHGHLETLICELGES